MRTVDFSEVLGAASELGGLDYDNLAVKDFRTLRRGISLALQNGWEAAKWPEWCPIEKRYFRDVYAATTNYPAGAEVYYPASNKYYIALRGAGVTGQAPATLSGSTYTTNTAYWAESSTSYSANGWATGTGYAVGNQVYYAVTDAFYQCHTAHTSSGVLTPNATGASERWGVLTALDRYVAYEQTGKTSLAEVFTIWDADPRTDARASEVGFTLNENGAGVLSGPNVVWVEFRRRCPTLTGDDWVSTAIYTANLDQVYFSGNFYNCITTTTAGQSPATTPAKWALVEIPWVLRPWLTQAGFASWLRGDGQTERAIAEMEVAGGLLATAWGKVVRQQGQVRRLSVGTY